MVKLRRDFESLRRTIAEPAPAFVEPYDGSMRSTSASTATSPGDDARDEPVWSR